MAFFAKKGENKGKKDDKSSDSDDVPDELPSLAEDMVDATETSDENSDEPSNAPDELPLLNEGEEEMQEELDKARKARGEFDKGPKEESPIPQRSGNTDPVEESEQLDETFFSQLKEQGIDNLPTDLLKDMKHFWKEKGLKSGEVKGDTELNLDQQIQKKILALQKYEKNWKNATEEIQKNRERLENIEVEITLIGQDLKKDISKLKDFKSLKNKYHGEVGKYITSLKKSPDHHAFVLSNGKKITGIDDLKKALKEMDSHVFHHHVSAHKNDFATWIDHVFHEPDLATKLRHAKNKKEMIDLL